MRIMMTSSVSLALVLMAGCNAVVSGGAGGGGAGGTGSTTTSAISSTGTGGTSSASTGGTGTGGLMPLDPPGPKDPDAVLHAAIVMGSCMVDWSINRLVEGLYTIKYGSAFTNVFYNSTQCFAARTNGCKALEECLGITVDATGPCALSCDGSTVEVCNNMYKSHLNCAQLGLGCDPMSGPQCVEPLPACDGNTYPHACVNGAPKYCFEKEITGPVCADYGTICNDNSLATYPRCSGSGPLCLPSSPVYFSAIVFDRGVACDGTDLRACVNRYEHLLDCSSLAPGFTCQAAAFFYYCGFGNECTPGEGTASTCEGDQVVVCNAGRIDKVDCKALGFTGCDPALGICSPNPFSP